jgi:hypothetical protein
MEKFQKTERDLRRSSATLTVMLHLRLRLRMTEQREGDVP